MTGTGKRRWFVALLLGALLAGTGVSAGGAPAMASPGTSRPDVRAQVLALFGHHGMNTWQPAAPGAPAAVRGLPAAIPTPGTRSNLSGVFCTSQTNCLAVGSLDSATSGATLNQVLHWNGTAWTRLSVPSPGGTAQGDFSELLAVRCRTAKDCWSVGDYANDAGATLSQALHWNGTKWSVKATPTPGGTLASDKNELFDIACPAASTCFAAGQYGNLGQDTAVLLNEILRWNGTTWSVVASIPQPAGTSAQDFQGLNGIRCTSASSCLAVGGAGTEVVFQNEALRWNGTTWSTLTVPNPVVPGQDRLNVLSGLACASATDCWAAGQDGGFDQVRTAFDELLHWDGTTWTQDTTVRSPDGPGFGSVSELLGITCISGTDCWAVGDSGSIRNGAGDIVNQTQHWDGTKWSLVIPPNPGGIADGSANSLYSVRCTFKTDCWAVGSLQEFTTNQALHWNGTTWSAG